ncbi:MBL fold metallo-hydrolase [Mycobacterium sp. NPDC003323]
MRQIRTDLWETRVDNPFPGLTTHAYLWTGAPAGNVLFYSTATADEFDEMSALGGVAHQYLSHRDEAGPQLARIKARFGSVLHAPAAEAADIGEHAAIDVPLSGRHVDGNGVEVIPTPGHSPGSTCYLVPGANGQSYLFTGDTVLLGEDGTWFAGYLPGHSDAAALSSSLRVLGHERPDLVISSAFTGQSGVHAPGAHRWAECAEQARTGVKLLA